MSRLIKLTNALIILTLFFACAHQPKNRDVIYQASTISALLEGCFDGQVDFREIKKHGDFGIGALDGVDGELIWLDGLFFQIKGDGSIHPVPDSMTTPYAIVTFFEPDQSAEVRDIENYAQLEAFLDSLIATKNVFYAVKIEGEFTYVKARSVHRQSKPYRPLVEVVKDQSVFEFDKVRGVLAGFRFPAYVAGLNFPGYHFHFINETRTAGGHLIDVKITKAGVEIDISHNFSLVLPKGEDFYRLDLSKDKQQELKKVQGR